VSIKKQKGLYLYFRTSELVYIGRSFDPFGKRVDQGYGSIHPKNCYIDGQSTNCHLNTLIAAVSERVSFYVHPMTEDSEIAATEHALIREQKPPWNIALTR
jgi:hypothetical protein